MGATFWWVSIQWISRHSKPKIDKSSLVASFMLVVVVYCSGTQWFPWLLHSNIGLTVYRLVIPKRSYMYSLQVSYSWTVITNSDHSFKTLFLSLPHQHNARLYEGLVVVVCVVAAVSGISDVLVLLLDSGCPLDVPDIMEPSPALHSTGNLWTTTQW